DMGKGAAAVGLGRWLEVSPAVLALIALAAVAGHLFPVFGGFRGGKGVATTLGVVLAAMPVVGALLLLLWLLVAAAWRYSSLAALVASAAMPVLAWLVDGRPAMLGLSGTLFLVVLLRHRENIARLWKGTEGKIGQRVKTSNGHTVK
ncbi:MAG: glycerol-3-phosphate acyltransferase, partial [candidate division NC10 bacterium]|nr:glycerol-3-phosphate acyltransferase [candidate division NC10 bacterium]